MGSLIKNSRKFFITTRVRVKQQGLHWQRETF